MRHQKAGKKLGRNSSHRKAMFRNMVTSLFKHEQLETTDTKAKLLRQKAEKMITLAKRGDLHARRQALSYMADKATTHKLFDELKDRYIDRQGGYVRIIKKATRKGDCAPISVIQLLPEEGGGGKKKGKKKTKTASPKPKVKKENKIKETEKSDQEDDS
jgi:large subunit ribosomal protein L17